MSSLSDLEYDHYSSGKETSTTAYGEVSDPAATTTIATTSALATGTWDISCYTNLAGTTSGTDRPNLTLNVDGSSVATILSTMGGITDRFDIRVNLDSSVAVSIVSGSSVATVGSVYRATIVANKVSSE